MAEPIDAVFALLTGVSATIDGATVTLAASTKSRPPFDNNLVKYPFLGYEEGTPELCVFVEELSGADNTKVIGGGLNHTISFVKVTIRSRTHDYVGGLAMAKACLTACHYASPSGYYACVVAEPQPNHEGRDETMCHLFTLTVELRKLA